MTLPNNRYANSYLPVRTFLNSYRALSDGQAGVRHLEEYIQSQSSFLLSDWKVIWIGACALLRTSIELFQVDAKSCINENIRNEISSEWVSIGKDKKGHSIFWEFLRKERNNILHEYEWAAYEVWMDQDGVMRPPHISFLTIEPEEFNAVLIMRGGPYKGRNSLELLQESAEWVEARIFDAIRRAGFEPDEERNLVTFEKRPPAPPSVLG